MRSLCTGVILAGGQNSRFSGTNKTLFKIGKKRILDHILEVFREIFNEIILVTNDPLQYIEWDLNIVTDIFTIRSSLTGLHAGLFYTTTPYAFFAACDTPFLKKELILSMLTKTEKRVDVVIPETSKGLEPLFAIYSEKCLRIIEQQLYKNEFKIRQFFQKVRVKKIPEPELRQNDPDLTSFFNVNTPEDLAIAKQMAENTD